jgi:hypothetical protein
MDFERASSLRSVLDAHRNDGEYLLHSARMVGDEQDHAIWRAGARAWREEVAASIADAASADAAVQFRRAAIENVPPGSWKPQYVAEVKLVKDGIARLEAIAEDLGASRLEAIAEEFDEHSAVLAA